MRVGAALAVLAVAVVAAVAAPDGHVHARPGALVERSGWTAYAPLGDGRSSTVYAYPDRMVVAPPGAVPAGARTLFGATDAPSGVVTSDGRLVVPVAAAVHPEIQVIR